MAHRAEKVEKLKKLVSLWYTVVPEIRKKYMGKDVSTYDKKDMERVNNLFGQITDLQKELKLPQSDKFKMLMELM